MSHANFLKDQFAKKHGLTEDKRRRLRNSGCVGPLLVDAFRCGRVARFSSCANCAHAIPGNDHNTLWLKNGKPVAVVTQPYGYFMFQQLAAFLAEHGLFAMMDTWPSWHGHGALTLIVYTAGALDSVDPS